jgi:hypothetical protein
VSISIAALALQLNFAEGPFVDSGGVIHKITPDIAQAVGDGIAAGAGSWALGADGVPMLCAFIRSESNFDPSAFCPNLEIAPNHQWPTPEEAAAHTDYGLCMVNGDGTYLGINAIERSIDYLCAALIRNLAWASVRHYPPEVAYEAYNQGRTGAEKLYLGNRREIADRRVLDQPRYTPERRVAQRRVKDVGNVPSIQRCNYGRVIAERITEYVGMGVQ